MVITRSLCFNVKNPTVLSHRISGNTENKQIYFGNGGILSIWSDIRTLSVTKKKFKKRHRQPKITSIFVLILSTCLWKECLPYFLYSSTK